MAEGEDSGFGETGFVTRRGILDADELAVVNENVDRLIADKVPELSRELVYYDDVSETATLKQIQRLFDHDPFFAEMMFGSRFEALAAELLGEPVVGKNMQFFDKPPGSSRATPPHQDGFYFMLSPCEAVTMWLALEDVGEAQGCVRYVAGSHRLGLRPHGASHVLGFSQRITDFTDSDREGEVAMPCAAGDLIAHHALTIHSAGANRTADRSRRALGFIYYGASAREDVAAHRAYQERLAAELSAERRI